MRRYLVTDTNPAARRRALFLLDKNAPGCFEILQNALLTDESEVIRHDAAFLLGELKDRRAIATLMQVMKNDSSDLVRHEAIEVLGDLEVLTAEIANLLRAFQSDSNPIVRETAVIALATLELHKQVA